jgi:hypothetical protein
MAGVCGGVWVKRLDASAGIVNLGTN